MPMAMIVVVVVGLRLAEHAAHTGASWSALRGDAWGALTPVIDVSLAFLLSSSGLRGRHALARRARRCSLHRHATVKA